MAVTLIIVGMAGSGKSSFTHRLAAHLTNHSKKHTPPYILNLDPAVSKLGFSPNIDIRDTVDYPEVMKQYNLGPNGAIMTSLNLFTTKFDQVLSLVETRAKDTDHVIVDTPGQIEIFTWSASGTIITDALASSMPTCIVYVVDTPRCSSPATFMSNMLYACSILYKTKLPFIVVFNKTDVKAHDFAVDWMRDWESFQAALSAARKAGDDTFMTSLNHSMSLMLDEFYKHLRAVGVSALTGDGMNDFLDAVEEARKEYESEYKPELERVQKERKEEEQQRQQEEMSKLMKDMDIDKSQNDKASDSNITNNKHAPPFLQRQKLSTSSKTGKNTISLDVDENNENNAWEEEDADTIDGGNVKEYDLYDTKKQGAVVEDSYGGRWPDVK